MMIPLRNVFLTLSAAMLLTACGPGSQTGVVLRQSDYPAPPVAPVRPDTFHEFGSLRIDNYFWLKDRNDPAVMTYLVAENRYTDTVMFRTKALQDTLFREMKSRIKEDDQTVPQIENGYYYYSRTEKDKQYPVYCRKKGDTAAQPEVLFDVNELAKGTQAYIFSNYDISANNQLAAYSFNTTGSFASFNLKVKDLATGKDLPLEIPNVQSFTWANDNRTLFYTVGNKSLRPYRLYRHQIGEQGPDKLIYEEKDELFNLSVFKSKTRDFIYLNSGSFTTTEVRFLPAGDARGEFTVFRPRQRDVDYEIEHHKSGIFIKYKDPANKNCMVYEAPLKGYENMSAWKVVVKHDPVVKIEGLYVFDRFLALYVRSKGLNEIRVLDLASGALKTISFPEPVYVVSPVYTPEYSSIKFRYSYSSLNRPVTIFDYDMEQGTSTKLKVQEIPSGFNPDDYTVERLWATAADSTKVPMAIVYKRTLKKEHGNPALLEAYGSYGYSTDAWFRPNVFSLVDRGFIYGIAQVRGGSEMGEPWYEDGKLMKKRNTFTDFIACAENLVQKGYTEPAKLGIIGGSAGGLLMGAVVNMRSDLFNVVLALVPFVDVLNTMQDKDLPLTTQEFEQWGDPGNEAAYHYILSYSPYDNVKAQNYPNILVTAGWNDSQVDYHEPAKWVAKLRALKTDNNIVLLKTNLESGHGGATGRYGRLRDTAFYYAFLLDRMGIRQ
jgi:oligopeptidase B